MIVTILMFFVLAICFTAMFGFVKFSERVIAKPVFAPLNEAAARAPANGGESL